MDTRALIVSTAALGLAVAALLSVRCTRRYSVRWIPAVITEKTQSQAHFVLRGRQTDEAVFEVKDGNDDLIARGGIIPGQPQEIDLSHCPYGTIWLHVTIGEDTYSAAAKKVM
ncbi:hypothetical protein DIPPA_26456 [Diplonema papillatum]|nr:hypothetical protein DIPPA_26456 [Diplonema papillatum]